MSCVAVRTCAPDRYPIVDVRHAAELHQSERVHSRCSPVYYVRDVRTPRRGRSHQCSFGFSASSLRNCAPWGRHPSLATSGSRVPGRSTSTHRRRSSFPPNGKDDAMIATTTVCEPSLRPGLRGVRKQIPRFPTSAHPHNAWARPARLTSQRDIDAAAEHVWYLSRVSTAYYGPASLGRVRPRAALILPHRHRR